MFHVRKKDKVVLLSGKDKGKQGDVVDVSIDQGRVLVAKINFVKRHMRPTQTEPGGIREKEAYVSLSKVMLVCPKCNQPTRAKFDFLSDGTKARVCRRCGEMLV